MGLIFPLNSLNFLFWFYMWRRFFVWNVYSFFPVFILLSFTYMVQLLLFFLYSLSFKVLFLIIFTILVNVTITPFKFSCIVKIYKYVEYYLEVLCILEYLDFPFYFSTRYCPSIKLWRRSYKLSFSSIQMILYLKLLW